MNSERGSFRQIEHTADLAIEVTAPDLAALFATAAEALFALIADPTTIEPHDEISVTTNGDGIEELLHAWLRELLAEFNLNGFVGSQCEVTQIGNNRVEGRIKGERLDLSRHRFYTEIKGVTYHEFKVWEEKGSSHARIIFDV